MEKLNNDFQYGKVFHLKIDGKMYESTQQIVTGAEVKKLASIPLDVDIFLSKGNPQEIEVITNDKRIDLSMPGIEQFQTGKPYHYKVNGLSYYSLSQFINGAQIRKQAQIPDNMKLFYDAPGDWNDHIVADDETVDLAKPGTEKFATHDNQVVIYINSDPHDYNANVISYEDVITLGLGSYSSSKGYTVTYWNGPSNNEEGVMTKGDMVYVQHKMEFHVTEAYLS